MYQGLQFPLCLSPPLTLNRNQKIWKQILSSLYMYSTTNQNPKSNYLEPNKLWFQFIYERDFDLPGSFKGSNVIDWKVKG